MFFDAATAEVLFRNKREEQKAKIAELTAVGAFLSPSEQRREAYKEKLRSYGITDPDALEDLAPEEQKDYVTGFHLAADKIPTVRNAQEYVEATGKTAHYVEADINNLGGLNTHFHNDHAPANRVYRAISDIFAQEVAAAGETAVHIRHGGDEFGSVVIGATPQSLESAMNNIKAKVTEFIQSEGLHEIPHPKHPGDDKYKGVNVYLGSSTILPGKDLDHIFEQSSRILDLSKLGKNK